MADRQVRVGVGVLIDKDGKYLIGRRLGTHGPNTWAPPGGNLELGEAWEECAKREAREEAGIEIENVRFLTATNDIFSDSVHYITIYVSADWKTNQPKVLEPDRCAEWDWYSLDELPGPLFLPFQHLKNARPDLFTS